MTFVKSLSNGQCSTPLPNPKKQEINDESTRPDSFHFRSNSGIYTNIRSLHGEPMDDHITPKQAYEHGRTAASMGFSDDIRYYDDDDLQSEFVRGINDFINEQIIRIL